MMFRLLSIIFLSTLFISYNEYELEEDDCRVCYGSGYIYCTACNNTGYCTRCEHGWIECSFCSSGYRWYGEEKKICNVCKEHYRKICNNCSGAYLNKCWVCHGNKTTCGACNGTGKIQ